MAANRQYQRTGAGGAYRGGVVGAAVARPDPDKPGRTPADLAGGAVRPGVANDPAGVAGPLAGATAPPAAGGGRAAHFTAVLIADGLTLDALLRKIGLLRDAVKAPLAGRMLAVLDLASRLPRQVWYDADPNGHDARFWERWLSAIPPGALVLFDLGFTDFARWPPLTLGG